MLTTARLANVYTTRNSYAVLYDLLKERTKAQSISHQVMPTLHEHIDFVRSMPYEAWYLICQYPGSAPVGSIYLTRLREVGIFIFRAHQHNGYATAALDLLRAQHPGRMLANVSPANAPSLAFFRNHGKVIQITYELPNQPREEQHGNAPEGKEGRTARHA